MKYRKVEEDLVELRQTVKSDLLRFMEENVGGKWAELSRHKLQVEAKLDSCHQVLYNHCILLAVLCGGVLMTRSLVFRKVLILQRSTIVQQSFPNIIFFCNFSIL